MKELTKLIFDDMKPALGVTEPGAIAFAVATAKSKTKGEVKSIHVSMNSGMYKNAFTCGIPNSDEVGNVFSAALGAVAGNASLGLESLANVNANDNAIAKQLVDEGKVTVSMSSISSDIFIEATVKTETDEAIVTIKDSHTNITKILLNNELIFSSEYKGSCDNHDCSCCEEPKDSEYTHCNSVTCNPNLSHSVKLGKEYCATCNAKENSELTLKNIGGETASASANSEATITDTELAITTRNIDDEIVSASADSEATITDTELEVASEKIKTIHKYTLAQLIDYIETVSYEEISFIKNAYTINYALFDEGLNNPKTTFARNLLKMNDNQIFSSDERKTATLLCGAAIEARVIGLDKPAMSITGSGAHGIIATMPLYACYKLNNLSLEKLVRATALSYLICTYIKEYSGKLSAFCGCAIAAGTGMACALTWLKDGSYEAISHTINNMASGITGMICDGGNQGCTMKGIVAVDAAYRAVELALCGSYIFNAHGINASSPEETMHNMGLIASPGMIGTEKTIVEIFENKLK